jgi:hypothetical protein
MAISFALCNGCILLIAKSPFNLWAVAVSDAMLTPLTISDKPVISLILLIICAFCVFKSDIVFAIGTISFT